MSLISFTNLLDLETETTVAIIEEVSFDSRNDLRRKMPVFALQV